MGGEQDRNTFSPEIGDDPPDQLATRRVDPGGGFVEEGHLGSTDQRQGEREPLLLTARQGTPGGSLPVGETNKVQQFDRIGRILAVAGEKAEHLERADAGVHPAGLEHHADTADESGMVTSGIQTQDSHLAAGRSSVALEGLDGGGLASAVGAQQRSAAARLGAETQTGTRDMIAVADGEVVDLEGGGVALRETHDRTLSGRRLRF